MSSDTGTYHTVRRARGTVATVTKIVVIVVMAAVAAAVRHSHALQMLLLLLRKARRQRRWKRKANVTLLSTHQDWRVHLQLPQHPPSVGAQ